MGVDGRTHTGKRGSGGRGVAGSFGFGFSRRLERGVYSRQPVTECLPCAFITVSLHLVANFLLDGYHNEAGIQVRYSVQLDVETSLW